MEVKHRNKVTEIPHFTATHIAKIAVEMLL
jgi:hypothetical protein